MTQFSSLKMATGLSNETKGCYVISENGQDDTVIIVDGNPITSKLPSLEVYLNLGILSFKDVSSCNRKECVLLDKGKAFAYFSDSDNLAYVRDPLSIIPEMELVDALHNFFSYNQDIVLQELTNEINSGIKSNYLDSMDGYSYMKGLKVLLNVCYAYYKNPNITRLCAYDEIHNRYVLINIDESVYVNAYQMSYQIYDCITRNSFRYMDIYREGLINIVNQLITSQM